MARRGEVFVVSISRRCLRPVFTHSPIRVAFSLAGFWSICSRRTAIQWERRICACARSVSRSLFCSPQLSRSPLLWESRFRNSCLAFWCWWSSKFSSGFALSFLLAQRETIVGSRASGVGLVSTIWLWAGGSSSVFSRAFCAAVVRCCASRMTAVFCFLWIGLRESLRPSSRMRSIPIAFPSSASRMRTSGARVKVASWVVWRTSRSRSSAVPPVMR